MPKPPARQQPVSIQSSPAPSQLQHNSVLSCSGTAVTATVRQLASVSIPQTSTHTKLATQGNLHFNTTHPFSISTVPISYPSTAAAPITSNIYPSHVNWSVGFDQCANNVPTVTSCVLSFPLPPIDLPVSSRPIRNTTLTTPNDQSSGALINDQIKISVDGPLNQHLGGSLPLSTAFSASNLHTNSSIILKKQSDPDQGSSVTTKHTISETIHCGICGHAHDLSAPHLYEYREVVDADLLCHLCEQPLVDPLDTKCGHTFCSLCLKNHLAVQALCPEDKQIINYLECQQSSNLVKRLLDKLLVICPNAEYCSEVLARCDLESHLAYWCRGAVVACVNQKLGCPHLGLRAQQAAHRWSCQFQPSAVRNTLNNTVATSSSAGDRQPSVSPNSQVWMPSESKEETVLLPIRTHDTSNSVLPVSRTPSSIADGRFAYSESTESSSPVTIDTIRIELQLDGRSELGISVVGGCDTPLICVVIQELYLDGLAARNGRLRPGDQILEVNGQDFSHIPHLEACRLLSSASGPTCFLVVYREQAFEFTRDHPSVGGPSQRRVEEKQEIVRVVLPKCPDKRLGIKLAGKKNCLGLYVLGLLPDGQAQLDGRIYKDDRLLEINGVDLSCGTQDQAARLISEAKDFVSLLVSRSTRSQMPDILRTTSVGTDPPCEGFPNSPQPCDRKGDTVGFTAPSLPGPRTPWSVPVFDNFPLDIGSSIASGVRVCQERVVILPKNPGESLGMSVAGGVASQRGDVPIYVTNLHPNGIAALSSRVFRGDILLAVNEVELLGLSHERAVEALKTARDSCTQVTLRLLKGPEECAGERNFIPSWLFWLQLPRYCQIPRLVVLRRDAVLGLGFSIIGGNDFCADNANACQPSAVEKQKQTTDRVPEFPRPIVIKSIVPGSPCFRDGRLKCGDILLSVDQYPLTDISHTHAVALLKHCTGEVKLRIVSWPGTIV